MSRTIRRKQFNKKNRFFQHYWEAFSDNEIKEKDYIEVWKYHSDNYYTKSSKEMKQFWKNKEYRTLRREFKNEISNTSNLEEFFLENKQAKCIKWSLH